MTGKRFRLLPMVGLVLVNVLLTVLLLEAVLHGLAWVIADPAPTAFSDHPEEIRVLCLGDSNTYGMYLKDRLNEAWCTQTERLWADTQTSRLRTINLGWPGTTAAGVAENLEAMLTAFRPHIVLLMIGTNDYWNSWRYIPEPGVAEQLLLRIRQHSRLYRLYRLYRFNRDESLNTAAEPDNPDSIIQTVRTLPVDQAMTFVLEFLENQSASPNQLTIEKRPDDYLIQHKNGQVSLRQFVVQLQQAPEENLSSLLADFLIEKLDLHFSSNNETLDPEPVTLVDQTFSLGAFVRPGIDSDGDRSLDTYLPRIKSISDRHAVHLALVEYPSMSSSYGFANKRGRAIAKALHIPWVETWRVAQAQCQQPECLNLLYQDQHPKADGHRLIAEQLVGFLAQHGD